LAFAVGVALAHEFSPINCMAIIMFKNFGQRNERSS
jgi:hypothetical protein